MMFGITISELDERGILAVDLRHILAALGKEATACRWQVENAEASGPAAELLQELSDRRAIISGEELFTIANAIDQVVDGKFSAFECESNACWLVVSAVDSSAYDVTSSDAQLLQSLLGQFSSAKFIPGMEPPE